MFREWYVWKQRKTFSSRGNTFVSITVLKPLFSQNCFKFRHNIYVNCLTLIIMTFNYWQIMSFFHKNMAYEGSAKKWWFFPIVFPVVSCFLSQKLSVFQVHEDIDGNRCIESHNFITTCVLHYKDEINFAHIL